MAKYDFQVQLEKNASIVMKNPIDGTEIQTFGVKGQIMKGCAGKKMPSASPSSGFGPFLTRPDAKFFDTLYSFGDFYIEDLKRPLSMKRNPHLDDCGVEVRDDPSIAYPSTQYWSMYAIFTLDIPQFPDPQFRIFNLANREESPIRLKCRLNKPWGEEVPIRYELMDDEIALYPWNAQRGDFSQQCPITGGSPTPLALLKRDGDSTIMKGAWTAATNSWNWSP